MRRFIVLLAVLTLVVSCSDDGTAATTSLPPATNPEPTTTTSQATTTAPPPSSTTSATVDDLGPEGSGCTPGSDELPDGLWFGRVPEASSTGISFDLACWFSGDAAVTAAAEDGEESPPPNDYYVRNENTQLRELSVEPSVPLTWYPSGDPNDEVTGTFSEWSEHLAEIEPELRFGIWVTIEDSQVTEIMEKWVP